MRTSKIAQETNRVMHALVPAVPARRSSSRLAMAESRAEVPRSADRYRQTVKKEAGRNASIKKQADRNASIKVEDKENESGESPSRPQDDEHDVLTSTPATSTKGGATARKRKREPSASTSAAVGSNKDARRSPRKVALADIEAVVSEGAADGLFPRPTRRLPAKRIKGADGGTDVVPPPNWERVYAMTADMRKRRVAAVDTMGCENLADDKRSPRDRRLQTLVALMLSSQTKDPVTAAAIKNMQDGLEGGFCLESVLAVDPPRLNELICKVGFHNNKTRYIKATAEILRDRFGGDIPDTIEGLVSLPGVGPKMAYLTMSAAWGRDEGIGVDVHVHRITNLWGWHKTRNPEETRMELESWLPRDKWHDINHLLVGFGQTYCPPVGRKCEGCDLAKEGLCPSAVVPKELKVKLKRVKREDREVDANEEGADVKIEGNEVEEALVKSNEDAPPLVLGELGEVRGDMGIKQEIVVS